MKKKIRNTTNISATIPISINDRMDAYLEAKENAEEPMNRSIVVTKALKQYLSMIECPSCHRMTMPENYCSYCGARIDITEKDRKAAEFLFMEQRFPENNGNDVISVKLTDNQIRTLLAGNILIDQVEVHRVERKKYSKNIHEYIETRREHP